MTWTSETTTASRGTVAGVAAAVAIIYGVELIGHAIYPAAPGMDPTDLDAMRAFIAQLPLGAFLIVLVGWLLGTGAGAAIAHRLGGGRRWPGLVVGVMFSTRIH